MRCITTDLSSLIGKPIASLQTFLRQIAYYYEDLPSVFPNGIFDEQTQTAVKAFQRKFGLSVTGTVDLETWNSVIAEYFDIMQEITVTGSVYPDSWFIIEPYESSDHLIVMQAMMQGISEKYENIPDVEISGIQKDDSIEITKCFQHIFGFEETGIIDNFLWKNIETMYINDVVNAL